MRFVLVLLFSSMLAGTALADSRPGIGVLGDSYSEAYKYFRPHRSRARNWVEILSAIRSVDFGPLEPSEFHPGAKRFEFNYGEDGDTSTDLLNEGLVDDLSMHVAAGEVQGVVIFIGGNDLIDSLLSGDTPAAADTLLSNVRTMIGKLTAADSSVQIFLCTLPSPKLLPLFDTVNAAEGLALSNGAASFNRNLKLLAEGSQNLHIVDLNQPSRSIIARRQLVIDYHLISKTVLGDTADHLFLSDGIHIGTIGQGFIANTILKELNSVFGARIRVIPQRELYNFARNASLYE